MKSKAELEADVIAAARAHYKIAESCGHTCCCHVCVSVRALDAASKPHKAAVLMVSRYRSGQQSAFTDADLRAEWDGATPTMREHARAWLARLEAAPDEPTEDQP